MRANKSPIKATILHLDDEEIVLDGLSTILKREGYEYIPATSVEEAMKILQDGKIDIFLCDYFMPSMSGEEVVKMVRTFDYDVVIMIITGYAGQVPGLELMRRLGIENYYDKTDGPEKLLITLETIRKLIAREKRAKERNEEVNYIRNRVRKIVDTKLEELQDQNNNDTIQVDYISTLEEIGAALNMKEEGM